MTEAGHPRVFTIPAGAPFLDILVDALLDGRLVGPLDARDPFALADATLYLPTRRAGRAIRESFLSRTGLPLLLPRIRTLGDMDEDESGEEDTDSLGLPPAVTALRRQLVLSRLVLGWSGALVRAAAELPEDELLVPASPADAARLAGALARLIDQVGGDENAWAGLFAGIPADLAKYWEITLEFLKIATTAWPAHLAEHGLMDHGERRDRLIRAEAARLAAEGAPGPVIAAGSTGSAPATAALLAAVAGLPNGAVVLPGLDQTLDAAGWAAIGPSTSEPAGAGHPQYGLKLLLETFGLRRQAVESLCSAAPELQLRRAVLSEAMRPAATTDAWSARPAFLAMEIGAALAAVGLVEAANEREEALAIAVLLREAAETPGRVAALVTPDRGLARRVAVEMRRWDIDVDDSAGRPLDRTPPGVLARLVAETALNGATAETLLALVKHPLAAFGMAPTAARRGARALERAILRGPRLRSGLAVVRQRIAAAHRDRWAEREAGESRGFVGPAAAHLTRGDWDLALDLAGRVEAALAPLEALADREGKLPLAALVAAHREALFATARRAGAETAADEADEELAATLDELTASAASGPDIAARDYPALFSALIERQVVRRRGGLDPRIHIWGTLEARLQRVDIVVLGGLNEGVWPAQTRLDPLVSRPMRAALALEPPERRIGLAAHDFAQALGHPKVWLTRARRQDGEPRVASRWLQRIVAFAGDGPQAALLARGGRVLELAQRLDQAEPRPAAPRPRPSPPLALRPPRLSATQIETLIRDPYAIYARHVLKLRPFEPIAKLPEAAERGTLFHAILERFVRERPRGPFDAAATARLLEIGGEEFARFADFPEIGALWWPRFERIARWFVAEEAGRSDIRERRVEGFGNWQVTPDFELTARADRLDVLHDGGIAIVDYKTGAPPSNDEVLSLAPQLPLEALIVRVGGFPDIGPAAVDRLEYFHISGRHEGGKACPRGFRETARNGKPALTLSQALDLTETRLRELVADFARPDAKYLSRKIPRRGRQYVGDYDHLARVAEWSGADEAGDEATDP